MKWETDKKLHFLVGAAIALAVALPLVHFSPIPIPVCAWLGGAAAVAAGWVKEHIYDKRRPDRHTVDKYDFYATALGGVFATAVILLADVFIQG